MLKVNSHVNLDFYVLKAALKPFHFYTFLLFAFGFKQKLKLQTFSYYLTAFWHLQKKEREK